MENQTSEKIVQKLLQVLRENRTTVRRENEDLKIKSPFQKEIIIQNVPVQLDSTNLS